MRIGVVGVGYVGLVAGACLADVGNHVICVDNDRRKIDNLNNGIIPIYEPGLSEMVEHNAGAERLVFTTDLKAAVAQSKIIFLAVGTPPAADGSADISAVLSVAGQIAEAMDGHRIIVGKSTVPVGTHKKVIEAVRARTKHPFAYVSNPEFLKEGAALEDFLKPDRVIIGTDDPDASEIMKQLYAPFMRKNSRMIFMDTVSAELTKYAANAMLATRISFMNELSALCETCGADIGAIRQGIGSDSRIGNAFLFPSVGYGGSCFPKDIEALVHTGQMHGCPMSIAQAAQEANIRQQERFVRRIIAALKVRGGKTVAVWGLAFKAKTDDIRESPALFVVEKLLDAGLTVKAFDPEAMPNTQAKLGDRIQTGENAYHILEGSDMLVILTDWQEFRTPDFDLIVKSLRQPVVFDGRNLYDPAFVQKQGLEYHSIGRA